MEFINQNALKGYREAFYPTPRSPSPLPLSPDRRRTSPHLSPPNEQEDVRVSTSIDGDVPPTISRAGSEEDEREERMALEEMEREEAGRAASLRRDEPPALDEEDEWEGLYA